MLDKDSDNNSANTVKGNASFNPSTNSDFVLVDEEFEQSQADLTSKNKSSNENLKSDGDSIIVIEEDSTEEDFLDANSSDPLSSLDKQYKRSKGQDTDFNSNEAGKAVNNSNNSSKKDLISDDEQGSSNDEDDEWIPGGGNFNKGASKSSHQELSKEEKEKQIAQLKKSLTNTSSNSSENASEDLSPESSILEKVLPPSKKAKKVYNQRVLVAIGLIVITAIVFVVSSSGKNSSNKEAKRSLPNPEEARTSGSDAIETAELAPVKTRYVPSPEETEPKAELPPVEIPANLPPMTIPSTPVKEQKEVETEDFALELRAGTAAALKSVKAPVEKTDKTEEVSLEGLSISMILLEPFRSGISTLVKAQVITDVTNAQGQVIIPASSRVQVPFEKFEVDGRIINDSQQGALVLLPNGKKLTVKGLVKGIDGFAGIKGKVKKLSKGNVFARVGKTFTRIGARVVGVTTGGFAGRGLEETINQSVEGSSDFIPSGRIVEVLPGTKFTFNVN